METNYPPKPEPPRPKPDPKPRNISVAVIRDPRTGEPRIVLDPPTIDLTVNEQAAWRSNDGRLEIRFSVNNTPFAGATYKTARGGTILSGAPSRDRISAVPYKYTLLVTSNKGFFLKLDADIRVVGQNTPPRVKNESLFCRLIHWIERVCCKK